MTKLFTDDTIDAYVSAAAQAAGYTQSEIRAGLEFAARKARRANPPGSFDRAKRFFAEERTKSVLTCRSPSRAWPYPEMTAARTAAHCEEVFGAEELLAVRRVAALRKALDSTNGLQLTAHELIELGHEAARILKPVKRCSRPT
jgi:hypothetical protein